MTASPQATTAGWTRYADTVTPGIFRRPNGIAKMPPVVDESRLMWALALSILLHALLLTLLPILRRAALTAAIFAFTISLGEFGATLLISRPEYPTIPVAIERFLSQPGGLNYGQAMAMATLLMLLTLTRTARTRATCAWRRSGSPPPP